MEFLHNINIIHTDLKPENILFINSDFDKTKKFQRNIPNYKRNNLLYSNIRKTDIKIIDFGSAMFGDNKSYGITNIRQYRDPEVILQCCPIDKKSDI